MSKLLMREGFSKWFIRGLSLSVILVAWQIVGSSVNSLIFSTPVAVAIAFSSLTLSGQLPTELGNTLFTFFSGFVIASALGVLIGAAMARSKVIENALDPYVNALYSTPYVALVPLFIIWLGIGFPSRLAIVILSVVFVVIINSLAGFKSISKDMIETGKSFGLSGFPLYAKVNLPAAFPYIVVGLRLGIGRGLVGAIVGELFLQLVGLGFLLAFYGEQLLVANVLAIVVTIGLIGLVLTETLKRAEVKVSKWRLTATAG